MTFEIYKGVFMNNKGEGLGLGKITMFAVGATLASGVFGLSGDFAASGAYPLSVLIGWEMCIRDSSKACRAFEDFHVSLKYLSYNKISGQHSYYHRYEYDYCHHIDVLLLFFFLYGMHLLLKIGSIRILHLSRSIEDLPIISLFALRNSAVSIYTQKFSHYIYGSSRK